LGCLFSMSGEINMSWEELTANGGAGATFTQLQLQGERRQRRERRDRRSAAVLHVAGFK